MSDRAEKKRGGWWALAGMSLVSGFLLLGLYVGAYFATVGQYHDFSGDYLVSAGPPAGPRFGDFLLDPPVQEAVAVYPYAWMETFFRPIHLIDRKLRHQTWMTTTPW